MVRSRDTSENVRQLPLRVRPDLEAEQQSYQGRCCWVVKDPLALKYFRFEEEEYFLLRSLDGRVSAEELISRFETKFAPQRLTASELHHLLGQLHRSSLLVSDRPGQGDRLRERTLKSRRRGLYQQLANPLAIRFRGVDPGRFLRRIEPWTSWVFNPASVFAVILLALAALSLVLVNFELFQSRLPGMGDFFAGRNWLGLAVVLALTKVLHELGHALVCRRFGGECHELGMMLLVFTPCLYANVTDSWMFADKWKRIAVAAAGMYVELLLASLATFIWWYSEPGVVNQLALNVIFVCSVGTLLFNANPLMKYDGYYMLADWLEIPNLRQKASALVTRSLTHWLTGMPGRHDPFLPTRQRWLFWAYALAAVAYRLFVSVMIFWFLYRLLEPWGLAVLGQALAFFAVSGMFFAPLRQLYSFCSTPGRWTMFNRRRTFMAGAGMLGLLVGVLSFPLPHQVRCSFYLQPAVAREVFVEQPGIVAEIFAEPGERVEAGQPLVRLVDPDLDADLVRMRGELAAAEAQLRLAQTWGSSDDSIASQIPAARAGVEAAARQLARRELEAQQLTVAAPASGVLLPAQRRVSSVASEERLSQWSGQPLESGRPGCYLEPQTRLGLISQDPERFEAVLLVSQEETEPIAAGQTVKLWLRELPGKVLETTIGELSVQPIREIPPSLSSRYGGEIATTPDVQQREVPLVPTFQVAASIREQQPLAVSGSTGIAEIRVGYRSPASRLWRWLLQTFRFEM